LRRNAKGSRERNWYLKIQKKREAWFAITKGKNHKGRIRQKRLDRKGRQVAPQLIQEGAEGNNPKEPRKAGPLYTKKTAFLKCQKIARMNAIVPMKRRIHCLGRLKKRKRWCSKRSSSRLGRRAGMSVEQKWVGGEMYRRCRVLSPDCDDDDQGRRAFKD